MSPIRHLINQRDETEGSTDRNQQSDEVIHFNGIKKEDNGKVAGSKYDTISQSFPEIDKKELTRLMIQSLSDLGYEKASNTLKEESGLELDSPVINEFIKCINNGDFESAENSIDRLNLIDESLMVKNKIRFLIKRQKFLEHLFLDPDTHAALRILRNEINELTTISNIRSLTSLLMDKSSPSLRVSNGWVGDSVDESRSYLLNEISKFINPNEMIPKHRLFKLLQQAIAHQRSVNLFQFGDEDKISLYEDIKSDKKNFPDSVVRTLQEHTDEVWYSLFSHDGSKLVTASADHSILIYDVLDDFKVLKRLVGHEKSVLYASFSPDDSRLLTCGIESKAILWNVDTGETEHVISLDNDHRIWCADWYPNGECFVLGSPDKEIAIFDSLTGELVHKWEGPTINDLKITSNFKLIAATYDKNVEVWNLSTKMKIKTLEIGDRITSVSVSQENPNLVLINTSPNELQLWDWNKKVLRSKYVGHRQEKYIIRSCFGYNEKLVVSGSEDGRVFIWNKEFGALLAALDAHKGSNVNSVAWNPADKSMFVTCGDDKLVKVWGPTKRDRSE